MNDKTTRWPVVWIAVFAGVVAAMQVGKAPPVLNILREEFDLTLAMAGWVLSIVAVTGALIGMLAGGLSDRIGHRRTITVSLGFVIAGSLMGALSRDVSLLMLSRVLESVGFVGVVVSVPSVLMRVISPRDQRMVFGIWAGYMPFGMAIMMAGTPLLLSLTDWRGIWLFNVLVAGLLLLLFLFLTPDLGRIKTQVKRPAFTASITRVLAIPGPWLLAGCFMAYAAQWAGMMAWLPTFLNEISGNNLTLAALLTALVVAVNVPGNLLCGWLLHRGFTRWRLIATGSVCMALSGYAVFAEGIDGGLRVALAVFFSFSGGLLPTTLLSGAVLHSPEPALTATTNGVIVNGANTGTLLGPPALGALVGAMGGWQASGLAIAIGAGLTLAFAVALGIVERRLQTTTD